MPRTLCLFPDLHGIARGKLINRSVVEETCIGFSPGVLAKDIYGKPQLFDVLATPFAAADMRLWVRAEDWRSILSGSDGFLFGADAYAIGAVETPDGRPHPFDIRRILQEFLHKYHATDKYQVGGELEFFLMDGKYSGLPSDGQAYSFSGLSNRQGCITAILDALDKMEIGWRDLSQENEIDQYEIALKHTSPLEQADRIFLSRMVIRHIAATHGLRASFIAVNARNRSPNNLHLHISRSEGDIDTLAVAIQNTLYDAFCIYRPSRNSLYCRDIASFASNSGNIADGSRFAALRIIREQDAPRVELRTPTSDTNPYFAMLMLLAGPVLPPPSELPGTQDFDFDLRSSLERFIHSAVAAAIWTEQERALFRRLKLAEWNTADTFGGFAGEREALLKVI